MYDGPIISRGDAKAAGLKRYFTGKPCKRGHVEERYVSGGGCLNCLLNPERRAENKRRYYEKHEQRLAGTKCWVEANRDRVVSNVRRWREQNVNHLREYGIEYRLNNHEKVRIAVMRWREQNKDHLREYARQWRLENPDLVRANHRRRYMKVSDGPLWQLRRLCAYINHHMSLGLVGKVKMLPYTTAEFISHLESTAGMPFAEAKALDYEVDHIIPVSYIHMLPLSAEEKFQIAQDLRNLQFIPQPENASKGDKILPEHLGLLYELLGCYQEAA